MKYLLLAFAFLLAASGIFAQKTDSLRQKTLHVRGALSVTNNGFSFIPSFTLGKPAAIVNLAVSGKGRFSFEPEFRYALEGKPWSFIFIWRYKVLKTRKFQLTAGTHLPALNFRTVSVIKDGVPQDVIQSSRFFPALELAPNYMLRKNISLGMFYLYGRGADPGITRNTHFLALRANFMRIPLSEKLYLRFIPQLFYLKSDAKDGFYAASALTLAHRKIPFALSSLLNKAIDTTIPGKSLEWNISLLYTFGGDYVQQNL